MQLLQAQDGLDQVESRHDAQVLITRNIPVDPYTAWLEEHEAERRFCTVAAPTRPSRRFSRNQSTKAPWDAISVTLSPDSR
jgi:hypothetical protein